MESTTTQAPATNATTNANATTTHATNAKRRSKPAKRVFEMPVKGGKAHLSSLSVTQKRDEIGKLLRTLADASNVDDKKRVRRALRARDYYISESGKDLSRFAKHRKPKANANANANDTGPTRDDTTDE